MAYANPIKKLLTLIWSSLLVGNVHAAPPRCKTVERDGTSIRVCERDDANCESLAKAQVKEPSQTWNGCAWPATIMNTHLSVPNLGVSFDTHVLLVAAYRDSERMDITVHIEQPDHSYRTYERTDVPIIIQDDIPQAVVDAWSLVEPVGVAIVEATERGGKKEASHSYR